MPPNNFQRHTKKKKKRHVYLQHFVISPSQALITQICRHFAWFIIIVGDFLNSGRLAKTGSTLLYKHIWDGRKHFYIHTLFLETSIFLLKKQFLMLFSIAKFEPYFFFQNCEISSWRCGDPESCCARVIMLRRFGYAPEQIPPLEKKTALARYFYRASKLTNFFVSCILVENLWFQKMGRTRGL